MTFIAKSNIVLQIFNFSSYMYFKFDEGLTGYQNKKLIFEIIEVT